ncbi:MAG: 2-dehydropantoate 2-reductase N-terminal domain-containing protein, partial [Mizugakiibacter sp.]|uniref:2-dehydropantoate 2-reductase N-terminal domain-containing protein n=1 Tax=Mizugakiibacter sp. TaxID=1972610 RepID=UPI00320E83D7
MEKRPTVAVLGAGSWGTALAALLARNGAATRLWGRDPKALAAMAATRRNARYLPDCELPAELTFEPDLGKALDGVDLALIVVPSHAFRALLDEVAPRLPAGAGLAWAVKGFEPGTGRFLHE